MTHRTPKAPDKSVVHTACRMPSLQSSMPAVTVPVSKLITISAKNTRDRRSTVKGISGGRAGKSKTYVSHACQSLYHLTFNIALYAKSALVAHLPGVSQGYQPPTTNLNILEPVLHVLYMSSLFIFLEM